MPARRRPAKAAAKKPKAGKGDAEAMKKVDSNQTMNPEAQQSMMLSVQSTMTGLQEKVAEKLAEIKTPPAKKGKKEGGQRKTGRRSRSKGRGSGPTEPAADTVSLRGPKGGPPSRSRASPSPSRGRKGRRSTSSRRSTMSGRSSSGDSNRRSVADDSIGKPAGEKPMKTNMKLKRKSQKEGRASSPGKKASAPTPSAARPGRLPRKAKDEARKRINRIAQAGSGPAVKPFGTRRRRPRGASARGRRGQSPKPKNKTATAKKAPLKTDPDLSDLSRATVSARSEADSQAGEYENVAFPAKVQTPERRKTDRRVSFAAAKRRAPRRRGTPIVKMRKSLVSIAA